MIADVPYQYIDNGRIITKIDINNILSGIQYKYAVLLTVLSFLLLLYVLWNNFVRSPSQRRSLKEVIDKNLDVENNLEDMLIADEGIEPSQRVKRISRALDEYLIIPALALFYISLSYLISLR